LDLLSPEFLIILELDQKVSFDYGLILSQLAGISGLKKQLSADWTSVLHVNPAFQTVCVENVLFIAAKLND
jgi:hypothetical protein